MVLSNNLISEFAKITKDEKVVTEQTVYATIVEQNGEKFARIDGSDILTPISSTTNIVDKERVTVMIKNHTATVTGNLTSPSARNKEVADIEGRVIEQSTKIEQTDSKIEQTATLIMELGGTVEENKSMILQTAEGISNLVTRSEFDELGAEVESHASLITQTAEKIEQVVSSMGNSDKKILAEMADGSRTLSNAYADLVAYYLTDLGVKVGDEITWSIYVTPDVRKNVGLNLYFGSAGDLVNDSILIDANVETHLSYTVTIPEGAVSVTLYFHDSGSDTTGTPAVISYRDSILYMGVDGQYVTKSEFEQTASSIRLEVSKKANTGDPATSVDTGSSVLITDDQVNITTPVFEVNIPSDTGSLSFPN